MTPKKCMSIAKSLTDTQHMELEPLCTALWGSLKDNLLHSPYLIKKNDMTENDCFHF